MRRACFERCQLQSSVSSPLTPDRREPFARSIPPVPGGSTSAVELEPCDLGGDRRRHEAVDRLPGCARARGCPRTRRAAARSRRTRPARAARAARARRRAARDRCPGRVATPSRASSRTRSGSFQERNAANSSAPTRNTGSSSPSAASESTVRANGSSSTSAPGACANASSARWSRTSARRLDVLVPRVLDDPHEQPLEPEVLDPPRARARRARRAAGRRPRRRRRRSRRPLELLVADLDLSAPLRTPADRRASSSSSPSGHVADDAEAARRCGGSGTAGVRAACGR